MAVGTRGFGPRLALAAVAVALTAVMGRLHGMWLMHAVLDDGLRPSWGTGYLPLYAVTVVGALAMTARWINRAGPRRPLVAGLLVLAASGVVHVIAHTPGPLALAAALENIAMTMTWIASLAVLIDARGVPDRGMAIGVVLAAAALGTLGARLLGPLPADAVLVSITLLAAALTVAAAVAGRYLVADGGATETGPLSAPAPARSRCAAVVAVSALTALGAFFFIAPYLLMPYAMSSVNGIGSSAIALGAWATLLARAILPPLAGLLLPRLRPVRMVAAGGALLGCALVLGGLGSVVAMLVAHVAMIAAGTFVLVSALALGGEIAQRGARPKRGTIAAGCVLAYGGVPFAIPFVVLLPGAGVFGV